VLIVITDKNAYTNLYILMFVTMGTFVANIDWPAKSE